MPQEGSAALNLRNFENEAETPFRRLVSSHWLLPKLGPATAWFGNALPARATKPRSLEGELKHALT